MSANVTLKVSPLAGLSAVSCDLARLGCPHLERRLVEMQRVDTLGALSAGIAHDFNNVLAGMLGVASELAEQLGPQHPALANVALLRTAAQRARALVGQVLSFSRPTLGARHSHRLQDLVTEAVDLLRPSMPAGSRLVLDDAGEPLTVQVDATALVQVVLNLGLNAMQALPGGRGTVRVAVQRAPAEAGASPMALLAVSDDGIGMDAATQRRIFEPYFSTRAGSGGTGLGLATVSHVLSQHGGRIAVRSAPGQGSRFEVLLPLAASPPAPAEPRRLPAVSPQRVLLVDDDSVLRVMGEAVLVAHGHAVTACESATQALDTWRRDPAVFDIVVSDLNMGGLSGLDLAHAMLECRPETPFVLVSGQVDQAMVGAAARVGVSRVLGKDDLYAQLPAAVAALANASIKLP